MRKPPALAGVFFHFEKRRTTTLGRGWLDWVSGPGWTGRRGWCDTKSQDYGIIMYMDNDYSVKSSVLEEIEPYAKKTTEQLILLN